MAHGPQRREPRKFEPPPWEREQFERLERERTRDAPPRERDPEEPVADALAPAEPEAAGPAAERQEAPSVPGVDAMLLALKAEEPSAVEGAWRFGLVAAALVGMIGLMLVIWGMVALARSAGSGPAGIMGATIMSVMGGLFFGLAVWMGARSLKQRGVL
ncbi:MAG: hypothetical protein RQ731_03025 [Anaerosomatales bacterium]|nr:hypothetical protein [Anaerosomatales bacterium]MDT8433714.1 hypothetical protein [Anaerosomatales bacterium]